MPGETGATFTVSAVEVWPLTVAATRTRSRVSRRIGATRLIWPAAGTVANSGAGTPLNVTTVLPSRVGSGKAPALASSIPGNDPNTETNAPPLTGSGAFAKPAPSTTPPAKIEGAAVPSRRVNCSEELPSGCSTSTTALDVPGSDGTVAVTPWLSRNAGVTETGPVLPAKRTTDPSTNDSPLSVIGLPAVAGFGAISSSVGAFRMVNCTGVPPTWMVLTTLSALTSITLTV